MALALFFTVTLVISIVGMTAILWLKRYELASGRVLFASTRPRLRTFFRQTLFWFERVLPGLLSHEVRRLWNLARSAARAGLARAILLIERWLEEGLRALRQLTAHAPHAKGEASPFLREVAEHKKKLQEEREDE